jgi:nucleoside-diphosphate-sugar epimerase
MERQKIPVTAGVGSIGTNLVYELHWRHQDVLAADLYTTGRENKRRTDIRSHHQLNRVVKKIL